MHRSRVWRYGTRWDQGSSREEGLLSCIVLPPPTPPTPLAQRFAMHIKISYLRFVILFVVLYCKVLHCRCTYASTSKCVYMRVCMYTCLDRCICASMQILNIYGRGSWVWVDLFAILLLLFNIWQWGFWHIKPFWEDCSISDLSGRLCFFTCLLPFYTQGFFYLFSITSPSMCNFTVPGP